MYNYNLYMNNFNVEDEFLFVNNIVNYFRSYIPNSQEYFKYNILTSHYVDDRIKNLTFQHIFPKSTNIIIHYEDKKLNKFKEMFNFLKTLKKYEISSSNITSEEFVFRKELNNKIRNLITFDNYYFDDTEIHFLIDKVLFYNDFTYLNLFTEQLSDQLGETISIDKNSFIDYIEVNRKLLETFFNKKYDNLIEYCDMVENYINIIKEKINNN